MTIDQKKNKKISSLRIPGMRNMRYCNNEYQRNTFLKKVRIDKPIVEVEMLHYSKQHTSVRIARLMIESEKRDKARYVFRISPNFRIFRPDLQLFDLSNELLLMIFKFIWIKVDMSPAKAYSTLWLRADSFKIQIL